jgi:hypothetical protein
MCAEKSSAGEKIHGDVGFQVYLVEERRKRLTPSGAAEESRTEERRLPPPFAPGAFTTCSRMQPGQTSAES